jgi:multidrug efflux system membrane fusion protein
MKKFLLFLVIVAIGLGAAQYFGWVKLPLGGGQVAQTAQRVFGGRRQQQKIDEPPVLTAVARRLDVPVTLDAVGTVQALNTVVVRAQVDGKLIELDFTDGQDVKKGDILARIDPATYQAQYDQAVGKKAQDEAQLANARIDLDRYDKLAVGNYGSKQQADTQRALVAQLDAQVRVDQAAIDNAKAVLGYTTIVAPIDGRTGLRAVDAGNIVHASDSTGIVTITQVQPIAAIFNLPQQQLRAVNAGQALAPLKVQALADDNATVVDSGVVQVVDNLVDSSTGTVRVKAVFPNPGNALWPGQFLNLRLFVDTLKQAVVVPTAAVQRGPNGAFVYVVGDDRKAVMTPVTVGRQDERQAVIAMGLAPPARVITSGFSMITDGALVTPTEENAAPAGAPVAPGGNAAARGPRAGGGGGSGQRRRDAAQGGGAPAPAANTPNGAAPAAP